MHMSCATTPVPSALLKSTFCTYPPFLPLKHNFCYRTAIGHPKSATALMAARNSTSFDPSLHGKYLTRFQRVAQ